MSETPSKIDVKANRAATKWSRKELLVRAVWGVASPLFRFSPRPLWGWRNFLLRCFGATISKNVRIFPTVRIIIPWNLDIGEDVGVGDRAILYALGPIILGERATISQGAHLCAGSHDYMDPNMTLLKTPITIERDAWVCADAFVGPGVTIGSQSIVGARAVVTSDIKPNIVVAGNPAKTIKARW